MWHYTSYYWNRYQNKILSALVFIGLCGLVGLIYEFYYPGSFLPHLGWWWKKLITLGL